LPGEAGSRRIGHDGTPRRSSASCPDALNRRRGPCPWIPSSPPLSEEARRRFLPVAQPLVQTHPVTGVKSLFLCPTVISHIEDMDRAEGLALIETLMAHAAQDRYVYRHRWRAVIWDNRCTLQRHPCPATRNTSG
jgi:alpha-ketoglutarate-dependent taurine dioxygenase